MAKARRKMRRKLMKKMRKGSLSPTEYDRLMDLDREVNQLNRRAGRNVGLGAAAALYMAQRSGALDSLGEFLDERRSERDKKKFQKESQKIGEEVSSQIKEDAQKQVLADAPKDRAPMTISEIEAKELEGIQDIEQQEEDLPLDFDPSVNTLLDTLASESEMSKKDLRAAGKEVKKERRENERLDKRLERRGGFDPRTGEVVESAKQREKDEQFDREFDRFYSDEELMEEIRKSNEERKERNRPEFSAEDLFRTGGPRAEDLGYEVDLPSFRDPVTTRQGMDLATMIRLGGRGARTAEDMPEFSAEDLFRRSGPRVEDAKGGYTPFLRAMRDRIRRKFR